MQIIKTKAIVTIGAEQLEVRLSRGHQRRLGLGKSCRKLNVAGQHRQSVSVVFHHYKAATFCVELQQQCGVSVSALVTAERRMMKGDSLNFHSSLEVHGAPVGEYGINKQQECGIRCRAAKHQRRQKW